MSFLYRNQRQLSANKRKPHPQGFEQPWSGFLNPIEYVFLYISQIPNGNHISLAETSANHSIQSSRKKQLSIKDYPDAT